MHTIPTQTLYFHTGIPSKLPYVYRIFALFDQPKIGVLMTPVATCPEKCPYLGDVPGWRRASRWSPPWRAWCCFSCSMPSNAPGVIESLGPIFSRVTDALQVPKGWVCCFLMKSTQGGSQRFQVVCNKKISVSALLPTIERPPTLLDDHFHAIENMLLQWVSSFSLEEAKIQNKKVERRNK